MLQRPHLIQDGDTYFKLSFTNYIWASIMLLLTIFLTSQQFFGYLTSFLISKNIIGLFIQLIWVKEDSQKQKQIFVIIAQNITKVITIGFYYAGFMNQLKYIYLNIFYLIYMLFFFQEKKYQIRLFNFIEISLEIGVMIQTFFVCLKIDQILNIDWQYVFIPTYIVQFIYIIFNLCILFKLGQELYKKFYQRQQNIDSIIFIFLVLFMSWFCLQNFILQISSFLAVYYLLISLLKNDSKYLYDYCIVLFFIDIVNLILQLILYKKLKEIYSIIYFYENSENHSFQFNEMIQSINQTQREFVDQVKKGRVKIDHDEKGSIEMPKFVNKVNSTFYKLIFDNDPKIIKIQQNKDKISMYDQIMNQIDQSVDNGKSINDQLDCSLNKSQQSIFSLDSLIKSNKNYCKICFEKTANCIYMQCGHAGMCYNCSLDIWEKQKNCHICRKNIEALIQIDTEKKYEGNNYKVIAITEVKLQ